MLNIYDTVRQYGIGIGVNDRLAGAAEAPGEAVVWGSVMHLVAPSSITPVLSL